MKEETHSKIYLGLIIFLILVCGGLAYGIYYGADHLNKPDKGHAGTVLAICVTALILTIILITYLTHEYFRHKKTLLQKKKGEKDQKKEDDKDQKKMEKSYMGK